jgi:hypothetical protein
MRFHSCTLNVCSYNFLQADIILCLCPTAADSKRNKAWKRHDIISCQRDFLFWNLPWLINSRNDFQDSYWWCNDCRVLKFCQLLLGARWCKLMKERGCLHVSTTSCTLSSDFSFDPGLWASSKCSVSAISTLKHRFTKWRQVTHHQRNGRQ